ncbi:hypothetical protein A2Z53_02555 [Candidatus Giovannonibacteria bacterium RIFCSPHIGHO2_02_42_15]|uniref:DUF5667 domain-containing protein n=2 Tax=Candidatus Giovannoniibacteriota TaxID=1752738 RepID=A0A1F5VMG1_9BACT|nr:MAG: hypothetical protein UV11_C0016G0009 [Candidatus Giovannonibacteria bacterium GW2011_GWF2_42_19]OGF64607.1 MAG: hypothetical protein A2Z53_02555 [Candidatus Giovannonibacteria bacterium RIFCSPHIGHO2_02_42_15]
MNNNNNKIKKFAEKANEIHLKPEERIFIKNNIESVIKSFPSRDMDDVDLYRTSIFSGFFGIKLNAASLAVLLVIFILAGGGVAMAAEKSLPGDLLYPIKIHINESAKSLTAVSPEAKGKFEVEKLEQRLQEAEILSNRGELNPESRAILEKRLDVEINNAKSRISNLEADSKIEAATDISSRLEISLQAHEKVLTFISGESAKNEEIKPLIEKIRGQAKEASERRVESEKKISSRAKEVAASQLKEASTRLEELKNTFVKIEPNLDDLNKNNIKNRIESSSKLINQGQTDLNSGNFPNSLKNFQKAQKITSEAKVFIFARENLNLKISLDAASSTDEDGQHWNEGKSDQNDNADNKNENNDSENWKKLEELQKKTDELQRLLEEKD